jgi:GNAT superfamily N-acetyltransferase
MLGSGMTEIVCTVATKSETPACLAILPETIGSAMHYLIARRDGAFAGAAALHWKSWSKPAGFATWLWVAPEHRRLGVGRALIEAADAWCSTETDGLWTLKPLDPGGEAAGFATACGFVERRKEHRFQATIQNLLDAIGPIAARARTLRPQTAELRFTPLQEAPLEEAAWLIAHHLGNSPVNVLRGMRAAPGRDDPLGDISTAAMMGDTLAAVILLRLEDGVAAIDAWVVAEPWRKSFVAPILLAHEMRRALDAGVTKMHFHCDETVRDTMILASRSKAVTLETKVHYHRPTAES